MFQNEKKNVFQIMRKIIQCLIIQLIIETVIMWMNQVNDAVYIAFVQQIQMYFLAEGYDDELYPQPPQVRHHGRNGYEGNYHPPQQNQNRNYARNGKKLIEKLVATFVNYMFFQIRTTTNQNFNGIKIIGLIARSE